ncbi:spore germination protein [Alicyclobacillus sp. SO9]|nr:spore germination protein [Alicyclobacillus sp. SO9]
MPDKNEQQTNTDSTSAPSQDNGQGQQKQDNDTNKASTTEAGAQARQSRQGPTAKSNGPQSIRPKTLSQYIQDTEKSKDAPVSDTALENKDTLDGDMDRTKAILKAVFHIPPNADYVIREFTVGTERPWRALAIFIDGMSDKTTINEHILEPLMMISQMLDEHPDKRMDSIVKKLLPGNQIEIKSKWMEIINGIITGSTAVFVEGCRDAAIVETKSWEHRSVTQPATEQVVRGAHDAFTESFRANTALVRSRLRSENLITEMESIGSVAKTDVAIMYIAGLTNSALVKEVKRRLDAVDIDFLEDSGMLEQFLEDRPKSMIPQMMSTERPDRVAQMLMEGHVALFVGQNPYVIVAPTTLWALIHSGEDSYLKFPLGNFVRFIRWIAVICAILLPSVYVAVTNYHAEMLPTDLMLAIAASREQVPFPVILEVLLMEFSLELIREAGIRIPSVIGPTIGMVDTRINRN